MTQICYLSNYYLLIILRNTVLITSFRFLQPTTSIFSKPSVPKAFSATLGTIHILKPNFVTVYTLFSILGTCISSHNITRVQDHNIFTALSLFRNLKVTQKKPGTRSNGQMSNPTKKSFYLFFFFYQREKAFIYGYMMQHFIIEFNIVLSTTLCN